MAYQNGYSTGYVEQTSAISVLTVSAGPAESSPVAAAAAWSSPVVSNPY